MGYGYARVSTDGRYVDAQVKQSGGVAEVHRETKTGVCIDRISRVAALGMFHNGRMRLRCFARVTMAAIPPKTGPVRGRPGGVSRGPGGDIGASICDTG
jgi:hypothetical protein